MTITLPPELEAALKEAAQRQGVSPEAVALNALRERFLAPARQFQPRDEWERRLLEAASDCGVALSHEAVSSEGLYD
jgi:predicted transcriptional regulator